MRVYEVVGYFNLTCDRYIQHGRSSVRHMSQVKKKWCTDMLIRLLKENKEMSQKKDLDFNPLILYNPDEIPWLLYASLG
jgi:hypothetical protein